MTYIFASCFTTLIKLAAQPKQTLMKYIQQMCTLFFNFELICIRTYKMLYYDLKISTLYTLFFIHVGKYQIFTYLIL